MMMMMNNESREMWEEVVRT